LWIGGFEWSLKIEKRRRACCDDIIEGQEDKLGEQGNRHGQLILLSGPWW